MSVCICACVHVIVSVCICGYISMYVSMCLCRCMDVSVCVCVFVSTSVCMCMCVYVSHLSFTSLTTCQSCHKTDGLGIGLDGVHTVFGHVAEGADTLEKINNVLV